MHFVQKGWGDPKFLLDLKGGYQICYKIAEGCPNFLVFVDISSGPRLQYIINAALGGFGSIEKCKKLSKEIIYMYLYNYLKKYLICKDIYTPSVPRKRPKLG